MPVSQRGIPVDFQKSWAQSIELQERLRLNWFRKNEARLNEIVEKPLSRTVPDEVKNKMKELLIQRYQNVEKFPVTKPKDVEPMDPRACQHLMKPVDPAITKLIYTGGNKDGRVNYLKQRVQLLPEDRYYFPEASSFIYGWQMWEYVRTMKHTGLGRKQIIKHSFYRRRGVEKDPDWYREPATFSPTICN